MRTSDSSASPAHRQRAAAGWSLAGSVGALLLAISLWSVLASGVGQPLRALGVLIFFGAPALLVGRFVRWPSRLETILFSLSGAAVAWGGVAGLTFATQVKPQTAVVFVSALVGVVAVIDLSISGQRDRRGGTG